MSISKKIHQCIIEEKDILKKRIKAELLESADVAFKNKELSFMYSLCDIKNEYVRMFDNNDLLNILKEVLEEEGLRGFSNNKNLNIYFFSSKGSKISLV